MQPKHLVNHFTWNKHLITVPQILIWIACHLGIVVAGILCLKLWPSSLEFSRGTPKDSNFDVKMSLCIRALISIKSVATMYSHPGNKGYGLCPRFYCICLICFLRITPTGLIWIPWGAALRGYFKILLRNTSLAR